MSIKWRFFRHLDAGDDPEAEKIYRWHIQKRTGGVEPKSWKVSVEDYIAAAHELLDSMKRRGFKRAHPVVIGSNGWLRDGAHRVACSLFVDEPVIAIIDPREGNASWGEDWFRRHGCPEEFLQTALRDFEWLRKRSSAPPISKIGL